MKIEGMMCTHCEARVKKALGAWTTWRTPRSAMRLVQPW